MTEVRQAERTRTKILGTDSAATAAAIVVLMEGSIWMIKVNRDAERVGRVDAGIRAMLELLKP